MGRYVYQLVATTSDGGVPWAKVLDCLISQRVRRARTVVDVVYYTEEELALLGLAPLHGEGNGNGNGTPDASPSRRTQKRKEQFLSLKSPRKRIRNGSGTSPRTHGTPHTQRRRSPGSDAGTLFEKN